MEFYSDGTGEVTFMGYSLFYTGKSGMYEGNRLLSNEAIWKQLSQYVPSKVLTDLENCLKYRLSALVGTVYKGYLGVDMMICRFPENEKPVFRIHPCEAATRVHQPDIKGVNMPLHQFKPLPLPESGAFNRQHSRSSTKVFHSSCVFK